MKKIIRLLMLSLLLLSLGGAYGFTRGIYITQSTAQNKTKMAFLIAQAKKFGIDTFIIDVNVPSKIYAQSVKNVIQNGIHYVARIVIFPHGGTHIQVNDKGIWEKRLKLAKYAVGLGASSIQLDYIRYRSAFPASPEKAKYIYKVVQYYKNQLAPVPLQMDIFGIAAHRPAHTIGQDPASLASVVNAFCPMVYPSHFEPYREHAVKPYETIFNAVTALRNQIQGYSNVSIYAYIELFNYRYPLSHQARLKYITAQMKAAKDSGANGWYVWSATNHYKPLFEALSK